MYIYNDAFDEIAATIAHEIKNPVALALANLEIMKSEDSGAEHTGRYAAMEKQLYRINELAQYLVDSTLLDDTGEEVYIYDIIDEIISAYEHSNIKNIHFNLHIPDTERTVRGSQKRLEFVFSNIVKNAVEACDNNGVINIRAVYSNNMLTVTVIDNGCGITITDAEKALSGGYTTKATGSGMGLPLCRAIIARHGGELMIGPGEADGCRVMVRLPCEA